MKLEWDEPKRQQIMKLRGFDLLDAALIFEGPVLTRDDERNDYGETRSISIGMVDGECYVVVHTKRGDATRLITAWKGGRRDKARYQASYS